MTQELLTALSGTGTEAAPAGGQSLPPAGGRCPEGADEVLSQLPQEAGEEPRSARGPHQSASLTASPCGGKPEPAAPDPELAELYRHFERLRAQTEALGREIPDFDPALALRDPDFLRLTAPGVGMDPRRAWLALHPELLERRAARESAAALARSLASAASRPREGGGSAGAALAADYRSLPRSEQQRLKERILQAASRGEKIYP